MPGPVKVHMNLCFSIVPETQNPLIGSTPVKAEIDATLASAHETNSQQYFFRVTYGNPFLQ